MITCKKSQITLRNDIDKDYISGKLNLHRFISKYIINTDTQKKKIIFIEGDEDTGKTTFLEICSKIGLEKGYNVKTFNFFHRNSVLRNEVKSAIMNISKRATYSNLHYKSLSPRILEQWKEVFKNIDCKYDYIIFERSILSIFYYYSLYRTMSLNVGGATIPNLATKLLYGDYSTRKPLKQTSFTPSKKATIIPFNSQVFNEYFNCPEYLNSLGSKYNMIYECWRDVVQHDILTIYTTL